MLNEVPPHKRPPQPLADGITCRIVGVGGIGQPVATYLTRFLSTYARGARVILIDGDRFEAGNEQRMSVGRLYQNKATALHAQLISPLEASDVTILAVPEYVVPGNIQRLIPSGPTESVLLCVDNHATRKLVGEHVCRLADACLISGGNDGVGPDGSGAVRLGTAGNVQVHVRSGGVDLTPTIMQYHPEIANPADRLPDQQSCGDLAGSVPQILLTNLQAACCMLNTWWLHASGRRHYTELVFDTAAARMGPVL